jgi:threonine dehydratase
VFVPEVSPEAKRQKLRLGAEVQVVGASYAEAFEACVQRQQASGALMTRLRPGRGGGRRGHPGARIEREAGPARQRAGQRGRRRPDRRGGGLVRGPRPRAGARARGGARTAHARPAPVDVAVGGIAADSLGARRIGALG